MNLADPQVDEVWLLSHLVPGWCFVSSSVRVERVCDVYGSVLVTVIGESNAGYRLVHRKWFCRLVIDGCFR